MRNARSEVRRRPRRDRPKGAVAVEFAIGIPVVMSIFMGGFVLVYASFTKQRLTTATIQATRACAMRPANENPTACVRNTGGRLMAEDNSRCEGGSARFDVQQIGDPRDPAVISILRVTGRCNYLSPVWPNRIDPMTLTAQAEMPRMPIN